jgi:hypothetical protein
MAFDPARPRYTLPFAGAEYELLGTIELIEAIEVALQRGASQIAFEVIDVLPSWELAALVSVVLTANGNKVSPKQAKDLLWNQTGLSGDGNKLLRVHLYNFLAISLAPPEQREAKATRAGELLGKLSQASRGESTSSSASAS